MIIFKTHKEMNKNNFEFLILNCHSEQCHPERSEGAINDLQRISVKMSKIKIKKYIQFPLEKRARGIKQ